MILSRLNGKLRQQLTFHGDYKSEKTVRKGFDVEVVMYAPAGI